MPSLTEAALPYTQACQAVVLPQPLVREPQVFPVLHLLLPTHSHWRSRLLVCGRCRPLPCAGCSRVARGTRRTPAAPPVRASSGSTSRSAATAAAPSSARPPPTSLPSGLTADHEVVRVIDNFRAAPPGVAQRLPPQNEPPHVDVAQQRGDRGPLRGPLARPVLYLTLIRYDFSDWAVAIAVDPASRKNVDSIVELPASPLSCGANREWGAIRSFRSHRTERSEGSRSTRPILTKTPI